MITALAVAIAGGIGAMLRFAVDGVIARRHRRRVPLGTLVINVTGSFGLGLLTALALHDPGLGQWRTVLGTGLMGGYTTFSTASVEAVNLAMADGSRAVARAGIHVAAMLVASMLAAWLGLALG